MALFIGLTLVSLLGIFHHYSILGIRRVIGSRSHRSVIATFLALLVLHTAEILLFAVAYRILLLWDGIGSLTGSYDGSWNSLIYFSGINFATLGYTEIETVGPIRMVSMMQSLGGFMVLTWSATFIFSVWQKLRD